MEQEKQNGVNKLAARIVSDAQQDALRIGKETADAISAIQKDNDCAVRALQVDYAQKREAAVKSVLDGSKTRAALDGRKETLAKKRAVIDVAFEQAYQKLLALSAGERGNICLAVLRREAEGGELLKPSAADRDAIAALLPDFGRQVTLSNADAPIDGGFLLIAKSYEKDCSFRSILDELRQAEETNVAKMLFD